MTEAERDPGSVPPGVGTKEPIEPTEADKKVKEKLEHLSEETKTPG